MLPNGGCLLTCDRMDPTDHLEDPLILCVISPSVGMFVCFQMEAACCFVIGWNAWIGWKKQRQVYGLHHMSMLGHP